MSKRSQETHEEYLARRRELSKRPEAKAKARAHAVAYRLRNPDKVRERNRKVYAKRPGARGRLKWTYGITPEDYDAMLTQQNGRCAACRNGPREGRPLCVDHCHKTKAVRGLLCDSCNVCAGHIESDRYALVVEYLTRTQRPGWTVWGNQTDKFEAAA
jgi:hypothetical protein